MGASRLAYRIELMLVLRYHKVFWRVQERQESAVLEIHFSVDFHLLPMLMLFAMMILILLGTVNINSNKLVLSYILSGITKNMWCFRSD